MSFLERSLAAGALILVVLAVRLLAQRRLPKVTFYILWLLVLVKLLLPVSIPSAFNIVSLLGAVTPNRVSAPAAGLAEVPTMLPAPGGNGGLFPANPPVATAPVPTPAAPSPLQLVWLTGVLILVCFFTFAFIHHRILLNHGKSRSTQWLPNSPLPCKLRRPLYIGVSDALASPVAFGLLRPTVLLPATLDTADEDKLQMVLAHEAVHLRRFDNLLKPLLVLACCIHWFNPLVWVMLSFAGRDIELSCDEIALRLLAPGAKAAYATLLVDIADQGKEAPDHLFTSFGGRAIKERIVAVMRKPTRWGTAFALIIVLAAAVVFVSEPAKPQTDPVTSDSLLTTGEEISGTNINIATSPGSIAYQSPFPGVDGVWNSWYSTVDSTVPGALEYRAPVDTSVFSPVSGIIAEIIGNPKSGTQVIIQATPTLRVSVSNVGRFNDTLAPGDTIALDTWLGDAGCKDDASYSICGVTLYQMDSSGEYKTLPLDRWPVNIVSNTAPTKDTTPEEIAAIAYQPPMPGRESDWTAWGSTYQADLIHITDLYYPAPIGAPVYAPVEGTVVEVRNSSLWPFGRKVIIQYSDNIQVAVLHLDTVSEELQPGDAVTFDTIVGTAGRSGNTSISCCSVAIRIWASGEYKYLTLDSWPENLKDW